MADTLVVKLRKKAKYEAKVDRLGGSIMNGSQLPEPRKTRYNDIQSKRVFVESRTAIVDARRPLAYSESKRDRLIQKKVRLDMKEEDMGIRAAYVVGKHNTMVNRLNAKIEALGLLDDFPDGPPPSGN
jgi:hypothetical protein